MKRMSEARRYSIIADDMHRCYICGRIGGLHKHEVYFGRGRRELSKKYGLIVPLCGVCHEFGENAVHKNRELDMKLKSIGQEAFIRHYPELDFVSIFGRNYLL